MTEVIMPKMGDGMEEGTLLEWLKKEGDAVKSGEILGNIQTDKATLEFEATGSGTLAGVIVKDGQTVPVGAPMALILGAGEKIPESWGGGAASNSASAESAPAVAKEAAPAEKQTAKAPELVGAGTNGGRVKSSPLARKIADDLGVDLTAVAGSGPGGRVVEKDVRAAASGGTKTSKAPAAIVANAEDQKIPLNKIRQITAKRTTESKTSVPHFYVTVEVDLENIVSLRTQFEGAGINKPSINDFIIKACALALQEMPVVNSTYQGDHVLQYGAVNIGMAVALEDGLTVPVLRNVHGLSLQQISGMAKDLGERARSNHLTLEELTESTFSISNMGMLNVENFAAIINQPNAAIVAIGTGKKQLVVIGDDEFEIRTIMKMTGSFDHRVVDGAVGAKFMNVIKDYLEQPLRMLS